MDGSACASSTPMLLLPPLRSGGGLGRGQGGLFTWVRNLCEAQQRACPVMSTLGSLSATPQSPPAAQSAPTPEPPARSPAIALHPHRSPPACLRRAPPR